MIWKILGWIACAAVAIVAAMLIGAGWVLNKLVAGGMRDVR